jgi:hypothetical protein
VWAPLQPKEVKAAVNRWRKSICVISELRQFSISYVLLEPNKQTNKSHFPTATSNPNCKLLLDSISLHLIHHMQAFMYYFHCMCVRNLRQARGCPFRSRKINFAARSWRTSCITCWGRTIRRLEYYSR